MKKQHWDEVFEPLLDAAHKIGRNLADHQRKMKEKVSGFLGDLDAVDRPQYDGMGHSIANDALRVRPDCRKADGTIDWDKAPHNGFKLDKDGNPIQGDHSPLAGDLFDRYGEPDGRFVSPVPSEGPYSFEQRSLPYFENQDAYHQYKWERDLSELHDAYASADPDVRAAIDSALSDIRADLTINDIPNVAQRGEAAAIPAWGTPGGATQDMLPLSVELLELLGMVSEL